MSTQCALFSILLVILPTPAHSRSTADVIRGLGDFIDDNRWILKLTGKENDKFFGGLWNSGLQMRQDVRPADGAAPGWPNGVMVVPPESMVTDDKLANVSGYKLQYITAWEETFALLAEERADKDGPFLTQILPLLDAIQLFGGPLGELASYVKEWHHELQHRYILCTFTDGDGAELIIRLERLVTGIFVTRCRDHKSPLGDPSKDWRADYARTHNAHPVEDHERCSAKDHDITLKDVLVIAQADATPERAYNIFNRSCQDFAIQLHNKLADHDTLLLPLS